MEGKINLFGEFERKRYELLRASLREPFYAQSLLRQKAGGNVRKLPSFGLLVAKRQTRGSHFRDQSVLLVGDGALDVADRLAPPHDRSFRFELCCQTGKLIFNSTAVKDSSGARVLANAMPIAASAMSQRTPPYRVPRDWHAVVRRPRRPSPAHQQCLSPQIQSAVRWERRSFLRVP
jgi:hypothetical protein